jgi:hypothetical protein
MNCHRLSPIPIYFAIPCRETLDAEEGKARVRIFESRVALIGDSWPVLIRQAVGDDTAFRFGQNGGSLFHDQGRDQYRLPVVAKITDGKISYES